MNTNSTISTLKRFNWIVLQKGELPLEPNGMRLPIEGEHRCSSVLIWPENERPSAENTILTDPCFTDFEFLHAVQLLDSFGISFNDIGYIFVTHEHRDHRLRIPSKESHFKFNRFEFCLSELLTDISTMFCPGHDPHLQVLSFPSITNDDVWIVGDAILDRRWLKAWRYYWPNNYSPAEITETWRSVAKILSYADIIVPGHGLPFRVTASLIKALLLQFPEAECSGECKEEIEHILNSRIEKLYAEDKTSTPNSYRYGQVTQSKVILPNIIFSNGQTQDTSTGNTAIFLHGKLIGKGVERPALHCAPLLHEIVSFSKLCIIMPEFQSLLPRVREEPLNLDLGPISESIFESVITSTTDKDKVTFIAYSFGCILLAKLLLTELSEKADQIVFIAPVISEKIQETWKETLSEAPTLITWGTHDQFVKNPEGLTAWFPNASFFPITGGNHLYYLMPSPMDRYDENPAAISRKMQVKITARQIVNFLRCEKDRNDLSTVNLVESSPNGKADLTNEFYKKYFIAETLYAKFDNANWQSY